MKLADNVWKINANSNLYLVLLDIPIVIDTGDFYYRDKVKNELTKIISIEKIEKVIFTHLHADHIGNFDLFDEAEFYASKQEIQDFKANPVNAVLFEEIAKRFDVELKPVKDFCGLKIIPVPGHTRGSIAIWYEEKEIMFSGDTMFRNGIGRIDLPTSVPEEMENSIKRLMSYKFKILAPGHDY